MSVPITNAATCFGKIPSRGDFVKGAGQHQFISVLDRWASQTMEALSNDPRWKDAYDGACPVDFAFTAAMSRLSVVGHLRPSADSSGRRFPFIVAGAVEREDMLLFRCAPAGLGTSFSSMARIAESAIGGADVNELFAELEQLNCAADFESALQTDPLGNFVRRTTLDGLSELIGAASPDTVRRIVLAIGLLMRPALGQGAVSVDKEIVLPLAADDRNRNLVAALWIYLVSAFLRNSTVELQIVIQRRPTRPLLIIGFNGTAANTLIAALAPEFAAERTIALNDPEWIEDQAALENDYGVAKLSSYLAQSGLSLEQAVNTFREVFLGE